MLKNFLILGIIVTLFSPDSFAVSKDVITTERVGYDNGKKTTGFLAKPVKGTRLPAIIVIHEWWGLNNYIEERTKDFAREGYVALAIDMYEGKLAQNTDEARALSTASRNDIEGGLKNISSAINYIKSLKEVNPDRVATLGFCFGGGWSYQAAKNNLGLKVSVIYYGTVNPKDDLSSMKTIILGNFAEKDASIKVETVREFENVLKSLSPKHKIYIYPDAAHAFDNKSGANYNREASEAAWKNTLSFLKKYL